MRRGAARVVRQHWLKNLPSTGRVRVRARYRVRNSWRRTDWQHYKLTVDLHGVPQFKLQQRR